MLSKLNPTNKMLAAALCVGLFASCASDSLDEAANTPSDLSVAFSVANAPRQAEVVLPSQINLYGFGASGFNGKYQLNVQQGRVTIPAVKGSSLHFLSGLDLDAEIGQSESDFLTAKVKANGTAQDFMSASTTVNGTDATGGDLQVLLTHGTARIDLNTTMEQTTLIDSMTVIGAPAYSYIFADQAREAGISETMTYTVPFNPSIQNQTVTGATYVYETKKPVTVVLYGQQKGQPVTMRVAIPSLTRGKVYEISVLGVGAQATANFEVKPWEEGGTYYAKPDTEHRILFSQQYSSIPTGVEADYTGNLLKVSNKGVQSMKLTFAADFPIIVSSQKGVAKGVTVSGSTVVFDVASRKHLTSFNVTIPDQGKGRLGYSVVLGLQNALLTDIYDYVEIRVAQSDKIVETVEMAGKTWMAFNANSIDLDDQVYLMDECTSVAEMYDRCWQAAAGAFFLHGSPYKYDPYTSYNQIPASGAIDQQTWVDAKYMPCPEDFRVPTREDLNRLLPDGTKIPGTYTTHGETIKAEVVTAQGKTPDNKAPKYLKLTSEKTGHVMYIPFVGDKGDKKRDKNPSNSGNAIYLWAADRNGASGGMGYTKTIVLDNNNTATVKTQQKARQSFASVRCVKK